MSRILAVLLFAAIFAMASAQYYSYVPTYSYGYSNLGYSNLGYAAYTGYPTYGGVYSYGAYPGYGLAYYKK